MGLIGPSSAGHLHKRIQHPGQVDIDHLAQESISAERIVDALLHSLVSFGIETVGIEAFEFFKNAHAYLVLLLVAHSFFVLDFCGEVFIF
jgi:hypothetical protein